MSEHNSNSVKDQGEPLYRSIRRMLEERLASEQFPANRPLPSSRSLAMELGISRNTVNAAYQDLLALGKVVSRPRSGLYPAAGAEARSSSPWVKTARPDWHNHLLPTVSTPLVRTVIEPEYGSFPFPFLPGQVEPRAFPVRAWLRATTTAMEGQHLRYSLRDAVDEDDPLLIDVIRREVLAPKGIIAAPDEILVTAGTQQGLALLSSLLLDQGRTVAMGNPGYADAAHIFQRTGARLQLCPVDNEGLVIDLGDPDVVYVTPSHHHPTNVTMSGQRRSALLKDATRRDYLIVEDDFDSEVRYTGAPTPPMKAQDTSGRVVYLGTFSKFIAPGFRLGFVVAHPDLVRSLREERLYSTKHTSGFLQRSLALFIDSGDFHRALRQHRVTLKRKWETLDGALRDFLPWPTPKAPGGGLSFWVTGPSWLDATNLAASLRDEGVLIGPGEAYFLDDPAPRNSFRLGFNSIPQAKIVPGVQIIARAIHNQREQRDSQG